MPSIISGTKVAFLEPQEEVWKGESGRSFTLQELSSSDHFTPLHGIAGFTQDTKHYPKTLFRFPLRNAASSLSENIYTIEKVNELINALRSEAKLLLLFLRSIHTIEVYNIDQQGRHSLSFQVKVVDSFIRELKNQRAAFLGKLTSLHASKKYNFSTVIKFSAKFDVFVFDSNTQSRSTSHWLVANRIDSTDAAVRAASVKQKVFPWVGTSMELDNPGNGRIFCFLPMPIETTSNLPVHVNGTFGLNDDRRSLKWPGVERKNDPTAFWNELLVQKVIPSCYSDLLLQAKSDLASGNFYKAWPNVSQLGSQWESLLTPVFTALLAKPVIWCEHLQEWATPDRAVCIPETGKCGLVVERALTKCGVKLAHIPSHVRSACTHIGTRLTEVSPKLTRDELRRKLSSYVSIDPTGKHVLLEYCLKDCRYSELTNLQLLPLVNGSFESYNNKRTTRTAVYVCTREYPKDLFPNLEHRLVDLQVDPELHSALRQVAKASCTQLKELTVSDVAGLISESMPTQWQRSNAVSFPNSFNFPANWFPIFWNWVRNKQLKMFADNFILPVRAVGQQHSGHFNVVKLNTKTLLYGNSCNEMLLSVLSKFGIFCCVKTQFSYVDHRDLRRLNSFDAPGVIDAISHCPRCNLSLTTEEAASLRNLLGSSASSIQSKYHHILCDLRIFQAKSNAYNQLYSVSDIRQQSVFKTSLAVNASSGAFNISVLPSNFIVFTADDYYQNQLLKKLNISFISTASLLMSHIFPLFNTRHLTGANIDNIMLEVLKNFDTLNVEDRSLTSVIGNLSFVMTSSGTRECPNKLFDPDHEDMSKIFAGKSVFPVSPYNQPDSMRVLRLCDLHTSITAQEVLDTITSISLTASSTPLHVDEMRFSRAKAILKYVGSGDFYHRYQNTQCAVTSCGWKRYQDFPAALQIISVEESWLPVLSERPSIYPQHLPWKGEGLTSHLSSLNAMVSVSTASKASHAVLYGSQMYFTDPVIHADVLTSEESPTHLIAHLQVLISQVSSFTSADMMEILHKLYSAMDSIPYSALATLQSVEKWVYIKSCHTFVSPHVVATGQNPSFRHNLEPYLHKLPDSISNYSELFKAFGVKNVFSEEQIISTMAAMKEDVSNANTSISVNDCWDIVMAILNWLTENGTKEYSGSLEDIFVPVESDSKWPDLQPASEVTYTDSDYLKKFSLSSESEKPLMFIHSRVSVKTAECLRLTPLSEELDIAGDTFEDTGQYEPLTTRLKNILRDYKDGLTIVKELIQNADDAEATEVNICFDARTHSKETDMLFFPGMADSHGPALVIHNNSVFSDEDFENITKLAAATKQDKHLKIGKFGIGFCSVYHITDIPSFLSRDRLYIFDPTLKHLGKEIKNPALPGKRLKFKTRIIQNSKQLEPYQNLFGFNCHESYDGTMFRLPFRTAGSELSGKCYSEATALELLEDVYNCSENLILFLQHIQTITYQRINRGDTTPTTLFTVRKNELSFPPSVDLKGALALSIDSKKMSDVKSSKWLVSTHNSENWSGKYAVADVACKLTTGSSVGTYSLHSSLKGEVFCYLPLAQFTGLPVHISCNFAVINNRRGIWTSEESASADEEEVEWNVFLMESVIPVAYSSLLYCLKSMHLSSILEDYKFHNLWPLTSELKQQNPWIKLVQKLFHQLTNSTLFFSDARGEWLAMTNSKFLAPKILSQVETPKCVLEVLHHCNIPVVDLPVQYRAHLCIGDSLIDELSFIQLFFSNLSFLSDLCASRNSVVQHMLELYASQCDSYTEASQILRDNLITYACIPCSPDGSTVRKLSELIHPRAPFAKLYSIEEATFPLEDLVNRNLTELALKRLGIIEQKIPWDYVIERAQTVQALVNSNPMKGYNRIKFIIETITSHTEGKPLNTSNDIQCIEFLPVLKKPSDFPLSWQGDGMSFSCGKRLTRTGPRPKMPNVRLAGSQAVFLCEAKPQDKGCSHISARAEELLGLLPEPPFSAVLAHFKLIIRDAEKLSSDWVDIACGQIYEYLEDSDELSGNSECLAGLPCIWTSGKFIYPDQVSLRWSINGPYLYQVPSLLRNKSSLCSKLGIKECFSIQDIQQALLKMQEDFKDVPIDKKSRAIFKQLIPLLHDAEFADDSLLLPDEKYILHAAGDLAYNDAPWAPPDNTFTYVHGNIPRNLAKRIGVQPVRSKFLDKYSSVHGFEGGVPFGQHEELTRRIQNILRDYPLDVTLLKELLQNADDAKATKMHIILDKRFHGTRSVLSEEWQDLQGPALLVWNDSVFSENDLKGIQELGLGSKRSEAESIGQYGIGFNVVYHITDCPSFVTNDETLCVLDPHCHYVPGADTLKPGRRFDNLNQGFWNVFPDVKTAYLRQGLENIPQELYGGSLFRFPIRHDKRKIAHSNITEDSNLVLNAGDLNRKLRVWMIKMKEAMLFLNNVSELQFSAIEERSCEMKTIFHYQSKAEVASSSDTSLFQKSLSTFKSDRECKPYIVTYPLTLTEVEGGDKSRTCQEEKWLIQQGVGDIFNSDQAWEYVDTVKPRHGIAAPLSTATKRENFKGQVFCFLPLPVQSGLPVHVNGHFILNSTRRELWASTNIDSVDNRSRWNNNLIQALASSYANFLLGARTHYVAEEYISIRTALSHIETYYSLFPVFSSQKNVWNTLAYSVYKVILEHNHPVFCVLKTIPNGYVTEWYPPKSSMPADQVYYWNPFHYYSSEHKNIYPILERIGMKITPTSSQIVDCFNTVLKESKSVSFSSVTKLSIFEYYTTFSASRMSPSAIEDTAFQDVASFVMFTKYLLEEEQSISDTPNSYHTLASRSRTFRYPKSPFSHYLQLTADKVLRCFEENAKVLQSSFSELFPNSLQFFLHPELLGVHYTSSYFIQPDSSRVSEVMLQLMDDNLPKALKSASVVTNATATISEDSLKSLWKCFDKDEVFKKQIPTIIISWALLLSQDNRLFSTSSNIVPIHHVYSGEQVIKDVCQVVRKLNMPFLNTNVVIADTSCPKFTDGKCILSGLYHTNCDTPLLPLLTKTDLNVIIDYLQHSLKQLVYDEEMIKHLQSLPLFENIDGSYTPIWQRNAYIWPHKACSIAYQKWLDGYDAVFIKQNANWFKLGSADKLSVSNVHVEDLYVKFIFPHFHQMNSKERYQHLKYIKDILYQTYKTNSEATFSYYSSQYLIDQKHRAVSFISALKNLPCIGNDHTVLRQVSAFCDHTVGIFNAFPSHFQFLPEEFRECGEWLSFFRELGLQQSVSQEKFIEFCYETASGRVTNAERCSKVLLEYLFLTNTWSALQHSMDFFLRVSEIAFVHQEPLPHLIWLVPGISPVSQLVKLRGSAPQTIAPILWTVRPIVNLPDYTQTAISKSLGVITEPGTTDIIQNIRNICQKSRYAQQSLFANYPEDLVCPGKLYTLLHIFSLNFLRLNKANLPRCELQDLPCIPVHHTTSIVDQTDKKMVLVKPSSVLHSSWCGSDVTAFHPFLHCLPCDLESVGKLLQLLGVKKKLELCHIQVTLESAFKASEENELEMNTDKVVKEAIEKLHEFLLHLFRNEPGKKESIVAALTPLYLPDSENVLKPSKSLLYGDIQSYLGDIELDLSDVPYFHFKLSRSDHRFTALDICRVLPESVKPIGLSVVCEQQVQKGTQKDDQSEMALQLMDTMEISEIPSGIVSMVSRIVHKPDNEEDLKELVRSYLSRIEVVTVKDLKLNIVMKDSRKCIGTLNRKYSYVPGEETSTLYLDSTIAHSIHADSAYKEVANHLCAMLCKSINGDVERDEREKISQAIEMCLKAKTGCVVKSVLAEFGVHLDGIHMPRFIRKLGEEVPEFWHHRIIQDLDNVFNPMDYVGYEDREGHIIVAQIVHPVKPRPGEQKLEKRFKIYVREDDKEGIEVSILSLYQFLIGSKRPKYQAEPTASEEEHSLAPYDGGDEIANYRASLITESLIEKQKRICAQLREIWKLSPDPRRKALKRMFLRWHPDKNLDDPQTAEKLFQFLLKQIEHLEKGEPLDDPMTDRQEKSTFATSYRSRGGRNRCRRRNWTRNSTYYHDFNRWDGMAGQHRTSYHQEYEYFYGGGGGWGGGSSSRSHGGGSRKGAGYYFPFEERTDEKNPEEGERWVKQAEAEFSVLSLNHNQASACSGYFYVCFMAHQVAERALRGAVYALCGVDGRATEDNNLTRNARSLEAVQPGKTEGLVQHAIELEDYYLKTRYPNQWEGYTDTPAEHYTVEDADQAKDHARAVLDIVRVIMPTINEC